MKDLNIGVVLMLNNSFGQGVFRGIAEFAQLHPEWSLRSFRLDDLKVPRFFEFFAIDGLVVHLNSPEIERRLLRSRKPFINVSNREFTGKFTTVTSDDYSVGKMVAQYFREKGHRNWAFISHQGKLSFRERARGFTEEAATQEIACKSFLIEDDSLTAHYLVNNERRLLQWVQALPRPTAVFAATDRFALYFIEFCRKHGFSIPEDFAVVGVDNDKFNVALSKVPLSSVELGVETIGFRAAKMLSDQILGQQVSKERVVIPPIRVVERTSSEHFAVRDPLIKRILDYVWTHLDQPMDIEQLAQRFNVSRRKLERHWRAVLNNAPHAEIQSLRLRKAKQLLAESNMSCKQIASAVGLSDSRSLSLLFQKLQGCTPTSFRNQASSFTNH